jgi:lipoprotein NlpI
MKRWWIPKPGKKALLLMAIVTCSLLTGFHIGCDRTPEAPKVLIIGIDGLDFNQISPMAETGKIPNLFGLIAEGSHGPLRTFFPLTEPAGWTTIATGLNPDVHGVFDFAVLNPATNTPCLATSGTRSGDPFWKLLTDRNISVSVVGWPVTWPVETISGTMVTDQFVSSAYADMVCAEKAQVFPATEAGTLAELKGDPTLISYETASDFISVTAEEYAAAPRHEFSNKITRFRQIHQSLRDAVDISTHIMREKSPEVMAVRLDGLAAAKHLFIRYQTPAQNSTAPLNAERFGGTVNAFYRYVDQLIGELMALTDENTTIMVMSNYGYLSGLRRRPWNWNRLDEIPATMQRRREGTLFLKGPSVRNLERNHGEPAIYGEAQPQDIVPTLLAILDHPTPANLRGKVLTEMLVDTFSHPAPDAPHMNRPAPTPPPGFRAAVDISHQLRRRLFQLGCLEWGNQKISNHELMLQVKSRTADYFRFTQRLDLAAEILEQVCAQDPGTVRPFSQLAQIYIQQKNLGDARHTLARALLVDPTSLDIRMNMALVYRDLKNIPKAADCLEKAAADHPRHAGVRINLGMLYKEMNLLTKAEQSFDDALELAPHNQTAHSQRALMHELKQEWDEALGHWLELLRVNPGDEMALRHKTLIEQRGIRLSPPEDE